MDLQNSQKVAQKYFEDVHKCYLLFSKIAGLHSCSETGHKAIVGAGLVADSLIWCL